MMKKWLWFCSDKVRKIGRKCQVGHMQRRDVHASSQSMQSYKGMPSRDVQGLSSMLMAFLQGGRANAFMVFVLGSFHILATHLCFVGVLGLDAPFRTFNSHYFFDTLQDHQIFFGFGPVVPHDGRSYFVYEVAGTHAHHSRKHVLVPQMLVR